MADYGAHAYAAVTGIASTSYPGTPQFTWTFGSTGINVHNRTGAAAVFYSFDGVTDSGRLEADEVFQADLDFVVQTPQLFLRLETGVGPNTVDASVWG